jgi:hypothetical protein
MVLIFLGVALGAVAYFYLVYPKSSKAATQVATKFNNAIRYGDYKEEAKRGQEPLVLLSQFKKPHSAVFFGGSA